MANATWAATASEVAEAVDDVGFLAAAWPTRADG